MFARQAALCVFAFSILAASEVEAVQTFNEDIEILDATPGIIFNDADVVGEEWYLRGRQEYFAIVDPVAIQDVLYIDPALQSAALGYSTSADGLYSIALGRGANSSGFYSTALGFNAGTGANYSTALGPYASAPYINSVALGRQASGFAPNSIAIGFNATSSGDYSIAMGYTAGTGDDNSVAIGSDATANGFLSVALGSSALATASASSAIGFRAYANQPGTVILGAIKGINGAGLYADIGIGTSAPAQAVDVERSEAAARFQLTSFTNTAIEAPQYIQRRARGTTTAPAAVQNNDNLGLFSFRGYNGSVMGGSRATITAQAAGNFTNSSTPTRLIFATTPVGQTTPQQVLVITPDGKVQVDGQNLNVPDYVFEDDYELMPLEELRTFIDDNGHLPGIAPAHEVNQAGLDLAGSHMDHLRKIEELTLYTLAQEERIERLEAQLAKRLPDADSQLIDRVTQLERLVIQLQSGARITQH